MSTRIKPADSLKLQGCAKWKRETRLRLHRKPPQSVHLLGSERHICVNTSTAPVEESRTQERRDKKRKKRNPLDANNAHNLTLAYHRECTTCARVCFCTQEDHVLSSGAHVIYCLDTAETCLRMFHAWQPHVWVTRALFMSRSVGLKRHGLVCVCTAVSWEQDFFFLSPMAVITHIFLVLFCYRQVWSR